MLAFTTSPSSLRLDTPQSLSQDKLWWAIIGSLLLHIVVAVVVPKLHFDAPVKETPKELTIELVQPKPAEPAPVVEPPKEIKKEPIKPDPIKKVIPKRQPDIPPPVQQPQHEVPHEAPPPVVIAAEAKPEIKPEVVVPPPPPPEPVKTVNEDDLNAARGAYERDINAALKRNLRYPKIAQSRGIQGNTTLKIKIDKEGNVIDIETAESSGNAMLDEEAVNVVKRSNLKQFYPAVLRGNAYTFSTTVKFILAE